VNISSEAIKTDASKDLAKDEFIKKATEIMGRGDKFVLLAIEHNVQENGKDVGADVTVVAKRLDPLRILSDVLEFIAVAELQQESKTYTAMDRRMKMIKMMKQVAEKIMNSNNLHN